MSTVGFMNVRKKKISTIFHLKNLVISNLIMSFTWKILVCSKVFSLIEAIFFQIHMSVNMDFQLAQHIIMRDKLMIIHVANTLKS